MPHTQDAGWGTLSLAVRTKSEPNALMAGVRGAILSIDKNQPAHDIKTMDDVLSASVANRRLVVLLFGVFAMFALLLASIEIYGVIAYYRQKRPSAADGVVEFFRALGNRLGKSYRTLSQQLKLLKPKLDVNQRPNQENSPQLSRFKKLLVNTIRMMKRSSYPIEP